MTPSRKATNFDDVIKNKVWQQLLMTSSKQNQATMFDDVIKKSNYV